MSEEATSTSVWIEMDFDERWFPEHVWNGLFTTARSLRYVLGDQVQRVRVAPRGYSMEGEPIDVIEFAVTIVVAGIVDTRVFEFGPRGYWRACPSSGCTGTPFQVFLPEVRHEYEHDLINRPELRVAVLHEEIPAWLASLQPARSAPSV